MSDNPDRGLWLGSRAGADGRVTLPAETLLRHMVALGASGSGKTVLSKIVTEELALQGIPALCIDPQGDLCSLCLPDPEQEGSAGFAGAVDVVVFTPASRAGVPLCVDPVSPDVAGLEPDEQMRATTRVAGMVASLLGYDLDSDDGAGLAAVLDRALSDLVSEPGAVVDLQGLGAHLDRWAAEDFGPYARLLDPRKIRTACQRLARLEVGARRLLFHEGLPLDIELLLGLGRHAVAGRTRVAVVYLNALHSQEDKAFFVAALADRLYRWMLANPRSDPQALLYIDEVAPFLPPVRKPASKEALQLLLKQGRKYGVCCLLATQNPGDLDYRSMAQVGTWALGRLTTRQDLAKITPRVRAMTGDAADDIVNKLPSLSPGELVLLTDGQATQTVLATRRLYTRHETLDEERIRELGRERWHHRFAVEAAQSVAGPRQPTPVPTRVAEPSPAPSRAPTPTPAPATAASGDALEDFEKTLARRGTWTTAELADAAGFGEGKTRRLLKALQSSGRAGRYRDGRSFRYWATRTGARPDLGLPARVEVIAQRVTEGDVRQAAAGLSRSKVFGVFGEDETLDRVERVHRLLLAVAFEERRRAGILDRIVGAPPDERRARIYMDPTTLRFVSVDPVRGLILLDAPPPHASDVKGFAEGDLVAGQRPADLTLGDGAVRDRTADAAVKAAFSAAFQAEPIEVMPVFLPVWRLLFRAPKRAGHRITTVDGLLGRLLGW